MARRRPAPKGDKPRVVSVEKYAQNTSDGSQMDYDKFISASSTELPEMFGSGELTVQEALEKLREMGWDLAEMDEVITDDQADEDDRLDALVDWARDNGKSDNTYNWGWWGPTLNFSSVQEPDESGDPYKPALYFVRAHRGGDVRGNYGRYVIFHVDAPAEEAPWYAWQLTAVLKLSDGGEVVLDSEDTEAYHWYIAQDPSETFKEGDSASSSDVEGAFDWEEGVRLW